ncbi:cytochrome bo3 quinol oxidase subunit 4 [Sphingomonas guangdongensis]|uniref:Cytochrome bo(3) ubiquinol oxidase subunit 4 n=1 Tax=Sphingomonas guangdongensis TaxID=1141890 RepID=A0A285QLH3_9SPHN|nr:cytochrome o ubiquinol oxidase subunit IV [Sphingomonas guangdongensis]SOB80942.1 cytochrome bo3 quinol oxidase subunit 4 [Sphingomonas guangdongensis]
MSDATHTHASAHVDAAHDGGDAHGHGTRRGYLIGFALSVVLTAIPFWLVMTGVLASATATTAAIVGFAVVQIVVHTVAFLHVNPRSEGGWTLMAYVFTAVLVVIVLAGSLWIMYHLNTNMMPMPGHVEAASGTP